MKIDVEYRRGLVPGLEDYGRAVIEITEGDEPLGWFDLYGKEMEDDIPIFQGWIESFKKKSGIPGRLIFSSQRALEKICADNGSPLIHEASFSMSVLEETPGALAMMIELFLCSGYELMPVPEKDREYTFAQMRKRFEP